MASTTQSSISDRKISLTLTPHTTLHARIQSLSHALIVHLTSTTHEQTSGSSALGSFVYAFPNRLDPANVFSTPLVTVPDSVEFATRVAKILARRKNMPVYVSCSISLAWGPGGAMRPEVDEEMEALKRVVEDVTAELNDGTGGAS